MCPPGPPCGTSLGRVSILRRTLSIVGVAAAAVVFAALPAHATWSVIGTDQATGEVGVAVASCVAGEVVVVPVLVPSTGAAASQANLNSSSGDQLVTDLQAGQTAQQIVANVTAPSFDSMAAQRQFGAVTLTATAAGYTGSQNDVAAASVQNPSQTASVQGNTLVSDAVVTEAMAAYEAAEGKPLADRLLIALQAGSAAGGDNRCGERTASSAALLVAKPGDPIWNQTSAAFKVDINSVPTPSTFVSVVPSGSANAVTVLTDTYRSAAAQGSPVKVQQLPWTLRTLGMPTIFAIYAAVAAGVVLLVVGGLVWLVWWLLR
ncbi:MAG: hypothetical protein RLZ55_689, partial [Actinomycetota bacterium]